MILRSTVHSIQHGKRGTQRLQLLLAYTPETLTASMPDKHFSALAGQTPDAEDAGACEVQAWENLYQSSVLDLAGGGEVVAHAVQQQLHALVLVGAAHEDRHKGQAYCGSSARSASLQARIGISDRT